MTQYIPRTNPLIQKFDLARTPIDAIQWTGDNLTQIREGFPEADARPVTDGLAVTVSGGELFLKVGWWLLRFASGTVHAMFPTPFAECYELMEDQP